MRNGWASDVYSRLAEVGATRKGSSFRQGGRRWPECVVTGGLGTIAVEYEGKKYFVCCTGCRDLFNEDPAGVLADYRQRKAEEKAGEKAAAIGSSQPFKLSCRCHCLLVKQCGSAKHC